MHLKAKDQKVSRDLVADIMTEQLGDDPRLTKKMIPEFALGCRRMTPGSGYLQSLRAKNVQVVTESAARLTRDGVVDEAGVEHKVDVVICATGFDTSFSPHFKVTGRNGAVLKEQFGEFPRGYLGITAANFPNLFRKSDHQIPPYVFDSLTVQFSSAPTAQQATAPFSPSSNGTLATSSSSLTSSRPRTSSPSSPRPLRSATSITTRTS